MIKCTQVDRKGFVQERFFLDVETTAEAFKYVTTLQWPNSGNWRIEDTRPENFDFLED